MIDEEKMISQLPIVVLDSETTGLHAWAGHRIVELAAVRYEKWQPVSQLSQLLNPQRKMDEGASAVTGIVDADLVDKPLFADIADQFLTLVEGAVIVAHNASFDAGFISVELRLAGQCKSVEAGQPLLPNPWLDTLKLARGHFNFDKNNLSHIAQLMGVRVGQAHRALSDVQMTADVFKRMVQQLAKHNHFQTAGDLLHAQGGAIYTPPRPSTDLPSPLDTAVAQKLPVKIDYDNNEELTTRIIHPYYLTTSKKRTYIIAWCTLRQEQRTFRIDRIAKAELL